jgi:hypothetical protein
MNTNRRHTGPLNACSNNPVSNDFISYHTSSLHAGSLYTNLLHAGSLKGCYNNPGLYDSISYHTRS